MIVNSTKERLVFVFMLSFLTLLGGNVFAENLYVVPSGRAVGVKLYTDGIMVVGTCKVTDKEGKISYPSRDSGINIGDAIKSINGTEINNIEEFCEIVASSLQGVTLGIKRGNECFDTTVVPAIDAEGKPKLGMMVRDSTAGIGTVTYVNPENRLFGALGHGICDIDTGNILPVKSANILNCSSLSVIKGKKGVPGELCGVFGSEIVGRLETNKDCGIFGTIDESVYINPSDAVPVACAQEVKEGEAYILSDIDGLGAKKYFVEIKKVSQKNSSKSIVFEVTDKTLIEKTGGIVQGMSGSPIIQDGKLVGAVTHVFVNEPTKGYGIFIENMLTEAK